VSTAEIGSTTPKASHNDSPILEKEADETRDSKQKKAKPDEVAKDQRVVSFSEFKEEKKEAREDPSKKIREGQYEL
jgi:hypothetical protein